MASSISKELVQVLFAAVRCLETFGELLLINGMQCLEHTGGGHQSVHQSHIASEEAPQVLTEILIGGFFISTEYSAEP